MHSRNLKKKCDLVRNVMEFIFELAQLIKFSPKRLALFDNLSKKVAVQTGGEVSPPSLRVLCPTRWTVTGASIKSVLDYYESLDEIQQGHDDYAANCNCNLHGLNCNPCNFKIIMIPTYRFCIVVGNSHTNSGITIH